MDRTRVIRSVRNSRKFDPIYKFGVNCQQLRRYRFKHQSTLPYYVRSIIKRRDAACEEYCKEGTTEKSIVYQILSTAFLDEITALHGNVSIQESKKLDECLNNIEYELKSTEYWYQQTKKHIFQEIRTGLCQAKVAIREIQEEKRAECNMVSILDE